MSHREREIEKLREELADARYAGDQAAMQGALHLQEAATLIFRRHYAPACNAYQAFKITRHAIEVIQASMIWHEREAGLAKKIGLLEEELKDEA